MVWELIVEIFCQGDVCEHAVELVCELVSARLLQPVDHGLLKVHRVRLLVDQTLAEVAGVEFLQFQFRQVCSSFVHGCGYFNHVIFEFSLLPAAVLFFLTKKPQPSNLWCPKPPVRMNPTIPHSLYVCSLYIALYYLSGIYNKEMLTWNCNTGLGVFLESCLGFFS